MSELKQKIQDEAEDRYTQYDNFFMACRRGFREGAEWLDTEIVQPLRKENEGLKGEIIQHRNALVAAVEEGQKFIHRLSLSEGEIERLKGLVEQEYFGVGHSRLSDQDQWEQFKTEHNL